MILDQNQYSSMSGRTNETSCSNPSNSNLDSLIGGSIRILNSSGYPKQVNRNKPVKPSFKQTQLSKPANYQNSLSMKNISEIPSKHDYSLNHYNNLQLALKAATAALQKSKITASSNYIPLENSTKKESIQTTNKAKSPNDSGNSSNQTLSSSTTSALISSNQSVFQPYQKLKEKKKQLNGSILIPKSKLYRNTLVIDTAQTEQTNSSSISSANTNTIQSNSTSSALSSSSLSNQKLDTSDYDNIENDVDSSKFKKISIQINPLKRNKSVSSEVLNPSEKTLNDIDEDSLNNYSHIKANFETIFNNLDKEISNFQSVSPPPPKIQPFSGVLSKSLFSLVLKPQPVKPIRDNFTKLEAKNSNSKSQMKKKCVSTTNLLIESTKRVDVAENKIENTSSSKSVTTLNSKIDFDSSDNSINIDDVECDYDSNNADGDFYGDDLNDRDRKIRTLEVELKNKDDIIIELKKKLATEIEKNRYNQRKVSREQSENEKAAYENKLNELKAHFSQQLSLFEENERLQMQNKLNNLQKIYNDLKMNYKKNLDNELKSLKSKLNESETNTERLLKQIQLSKKTTNSLSTQTSIINERDLNNNSELLYFLRKLKSENNELRLQLETDRRRFQNEKEKWLIQMQSLKRISVSSNENLASSHSNTFFKKNNVTRNQSGNLTSNLNNPKQINVENVRTKSNQSNSKQQPFVKNLLVNHQHYL